MGSHPPGFIAAAPRPARLGTNNRDARRTQVRASVAENVKSLGLSLAMLLSVRNVSERMAPFRVVGSQGPGVERTVEAASITRIQAGQLRSKSSHTAIAKGDNSKAERNHASTRMAMVEAPGAPPLGKFQDRVHFLKEDFLSHVHVPVWDTLIILLSTMIIVPLFDRLKTSPILGFLMAGIVLGPKGLGIIGDVHGSQLLAEFGVVFFLFEMGLELSTSKLRQLKSDVFGLGTGQFVITGFLITVVTILAGLPIETGLVIGGSLALSSSAFVLQLLSERGELGTRFGRAAFGILLFQDLAIVPMMVLTPLLAASGGGGSTMLIRAISVAAGKGVLALAVIVASGKLLLEPTFKFVAKSRSSEAFVATILFTVIATSTLTEGLGLSDTLGAFLAGVMLAETKYRHQVEADIQPFRGLLLGLFFITVGFTIDLRLALANIGPVLSLIGGLLALKTGVITAVGVLFGRSFASSFRTGLILAQGGEFAFVIFALAQSVGLLAPDLRQLLVLVVGLSMAMTPVLAALGRVLATKMESGRGLIGARQSDLDTADATNFVIVAGFGRVGQSVCELLDSQLIRYKAFDLSPQRVIEARRRGLPVFFGDACRAEVLRSAGVEKCKAVVVTLDDPPATLRSVQSLSRDYPNLQIFVRAADAKQQMLLQMAGATAIIPELFETSLLLGRAVLLAYDTPPEEVALIIDEQRREQGYGYLHDEEEKREEEEPEPEPQPIPTAKEKTTEASGGSVADGNGTGGNGKPRKLKSTVESQKEAEAGPDGVSRKSKSEESEDDEDQIFL
mmetsp:Transcript_16035/g.66076  ORF Transcript_16035/g.66076 Transcript_16035/m.66076 type:complete len:791 (-) Transcript_16035:236-2608(-)